MTTPFRRREPTATELANQCIQHAFPLRPALTVLMVLPRNLTAVEAGRVAGFVRAVAFPDDAEEFTDAPT